LKKLDSRFHGNDKIVHISTFHETIKYNSTGSIEKFMRT